MKQTYYRHSKYGVVKTDFLAIKTLDRATAENCYDAILLALKEQCNIDSHELWPKLVGFGSDGANVMQGVRNGVAAKLRAEQPLLQVIHCVAHRLELGIKAAVKEVQLYSKIAKLLSDLYSFYHYSTLNKGLLRRSAAALGIKRFVPTRVGGTRWISHTERALTNFFAGYEAIVQHLLEVGIVLPMIPNFNTKLLVARC